MRSFAEPSWWECWGCGRASWVRSHLVELQDQLEVMNDWLLGSVAALQAEEFDEEHSSFVAKLQPRMEQLCAASETLLFLGARLAVRGIHADTRHWPEEVAELQACMATVVEAQQNFAEVFAAARGELLGDDGLPTSLLHKHFFAFALGCYAEQTIRFARHLGMSIRPSAVGPSPPAFEWLRALLNLKADLGRASRTCVAYFASALVGYFGIPDVSTPYDGSMASTVAFMVPASGGSGSGLQNNMKRFIGVAGGKLTGRLLFSVFCPCTWWGPYSAFAATFFYEVMTSFLMFGSSPYSFMSRLAAAFGLHGLLKVCFGRGNGIDSFSLIQAQLIGILFAAAADALVGNRSASDMARREWRQNTECSLRFVASLVGLLDDTCDYESPSTPTSSTALKSGTSLDHRAFRRRIANHHVATTHFGEEALEEPRLTRGRFNMELWQELVGLSADNGLIVSLLSATAAECQHRPLQLATLNATFKTAAVQELCLSMMRRGCESAELSNELLAGDGRHSKGRCSMPEQAEEPKDLPSLGGALREVAEPLAHLQRQRGGEASAGSRLLDSAIDDAWCLVGAVVFALNRSCDILRQFEVHLYAAEQSDA